MIFFAVLAFTSLMLFSVNFYGLFQSLRYDGFKNTPEEHFRFGREEPLPYRNAIKEIDKLFDIDDELVFSGKASKLVSECLAHLEWEKLDPLQSKQTVPFWENPILYILGRFSSLHFYQRYNFTDYRRTIERGFGICGDASVVLSQLLDKKGIPHEIVAFDEHVLIEATIDESRIILDPDFGILINDNLDNLAKNSNLTEHIYREAGFSDNESKLMGRIFTRQKYTYGSVYKFLPKRFILERISYWLFWYGPFAGLLISAAYWLPK